MQSSERSEQIFFRKWENIPHNANIGPSSWGRAFVYPSPWPKSGGSVPLVDMPMILWQQFGRSWYNLGHNLYQLPLNGWKLGGKVFQPPGSHKLWPKLYQLPPWTGEVDIGPNLCQFILTFPHGRLKPPLFLCGAFAPRFIWCRRPCMKLWNHQLFSSRHLRETWPNKNTQF